ncbi:hypothetical protein CHCC14820_3599 [Bacillus paralicheniformis]|nr:hypothetical protein [Bacillus paralicheniformis]OLG13035.1 hypothetical protein B4123_0457 [Bacillus paralicheniformis]TWJ70786.1 hypothetical protein CHCC5019_3847 [Bacillus paralicheniformis]TWM26257.1 hypothetical protein CHCC14821_3882 [Bacillus paralicheniformis]TWM37701.1 hypothetical protein CHCC14820_3599 [Bacillus paralicheniformis]
MYRHLGRKKVIVGRFGLDSKEEKTRKSGRCERCFRSVIRRRRKSGNNISQRPGVRQYRPLDSLFHALEQTFSFITIRCKGL